ncbi:MAG: SGNH/GDSL hydrolase family protein [Ruminococcus sp.]|nr:SGNH/GDSL hydrolase family protein [Ruminococcus sp.]
MIIRSSSISKFVAAALSLTMLASCGTTVKEGSGTDTAAEVTTTVTETTTTTAPPATAPSEITTAPKQPAVVVTDASGNAIDQTLPKATTSPNAAFYQDRLYVTGDSICHGFNVFGFVQENHCITQGSVSMWNRDYFYFDTPYGSYQMVDAVAALQPKLLYMSLGMNDVNMGDPQAFADKYAETVNDIMQRVPDINIVVASITPIDANVTDFTSNEVIRSFNAALKTKIEGLRSNRVHYFDAYSVIADPNTLSMRAGGTSGDGIHLSTECYTDFLNALFLELDKTDFMAQIQASEGTA